MWRLVKEKKSRKKHEMRPSSSFISFLVGLISKVFHKVSSSSSTSLMEWNLVSKYFVNFFFFLYLLSFLGRFLLYFTGAQEMNTRDSRKRKGKRPPNKSLTKKHSSFLWNYLGNLECFLEDLFLGGQWSIILGSRRLSVKSLIKGNQTVY